jgi:hypothetical protein
MQVLDAGEALLDGGRIWALLGQPQPALEMLLVADEEARAATCRSKCGHGSSISRDEARSPAVEPAPVAHPAQHKKRPRSGASGKPSLSSRDDWTLSSLASFDDAGTASASGSSSGGGSLSGAATAAAAAATAAAEAAAVAPSCALDDHDCQDCSGRWAMRSVHPCQAVRCIACACLTFWCATCITQAVNACPSGGVKALWCAQQAPTY